MVNGLAQVVYDRISIVRRDLKQLYSLDTEDISIDVLLDYLRLPFNLTIQCTHIKEKNWFFWIYSIPSELSFCMHNIKGPLIILSELNFSLINTSNQLMSRLQSVIKTKGNRIKRLVSRFQKSWFCIGEIQFSFWNSSTYDTNKSLMIVGSLCYPLL
jgi:hypothetical protein